jgi:hypothetical protein
LQAGDFSLLEEMSPWDARKIAAAFFWDNMAFLSVKIIQIANPAISDFDISTYLQMARQRLPRIACHRATA